MTREDAIRRNAIERLKALQRLGDPEYAHGEADDAQSDLAQALGLERDVPIYVLTRALWEATRRLASDEEVKRLRMVLSHIERSLMDGMKPLPGEIRE